MKLHKVKLKNFRCFEDFEIEFAPEHNIHVLIAENMVGKSALLAALRISIGGFLRNISKAPQILTSDHRVIGKNPLSDVARLSAVHSYGTLVDVDGKTQEAEWVNVHPNPSAQDDIFANENDSIDIRTVSEELYDAVVEKGNGMLPIILFGGTDYLDSSRPLADSIFENGYTDIGYRDCLGPSDSSSYMLSWLKFIDDILADQKVSDHSKILFKDFPSISMDLFRSVIISVLPEIKSIEFITVRGDSTYTSAPRKELTFEIANGEIRTLRQLSDGYRYLVLLAGELAIRSWILNKHLFKKVNEQINGVVLIDEFGIHLHPELQSKALHRLSAAFPHVQFIVTTHSPLMLNGLKKEQVHILEMDDKGKRTVRHPNRDIIGMGAEGILMEVFGLETTFDEETVKNVRALQALTQKRIADGLTDAEAAEYQSLMGKVGILGYDSSLNDPLYREFLKKYRNIQTHKGPVMRGVEKAPLDVDALMDQVLKEMME